MRPWSHGGSNTIDTVTFATPGTSDTAFYTAQLPERSDEAIANLAITLIHQADVLLASYLERIKHDFLENGGIREQMTRARLDYRR